MPQPPNKLLRILVPILLIMAGIGIGAAVLINSTRQGSGSGSLTPGAQPAAQPAPGTNPPAKPPEGEKPKPPADSTAKADQPKPEAPKDGPPTISPAPTPPTPQAPAPATTPAQYSAKEFPAPASLTDIGSLDPKTGYQMLVKFSRFGAGIDSLMLSSEYTSIQQTAHEELQKFHADPGAPTTGVAPLGIAGLEIDGVNVKLGVPTAPGTSFWEEKSPGVFEATIVDGAGKPAVRVTRAYTLEKDSYDLIVRQQVQNLGDSAVKAKWLQFGPVDLPVGTERAGMDKRRVRFGYLNSPQIDPAQQFVEASRLMKDRHTLVGKGTQDPATHLWTWPRTALWPNPDSIDKKLTPAWVGMTSRHFAVIVHPLVDPAAAKPDKSFQFGASIYSFVIPGTKPDGTDAVLSVTLESQPFPLAAGGTLNLDTGVYAGPLAQQYLDAKSEPRAAVMGLDQVVIYTLGGPCGFCTFQSITAVLHWWLTILHDYIVHDYALGIIVLVLCMRTILHPVTRYAQIAMQRFSKQMQALAPKQKKIQERYKDEPQKMREELGRLMREEHISYRSMAMGCLTPFLQTPVWIALYAMLFFMFELRHEPAFFGVFQWASQKIAGVKWSFLADLSEPDNFIVFGAPLKIPLVGWQVSSLNLLPILLGIVFFIQQKYLTPPSATPLTPEQQQQQKIMKIITVVMFPLFMYGQSSALTLYFLMNSTLGIIESRHIRRHAQKMDLLKPPGSGGSGPPLTGRDKLPPGKPTLMQRLQQFAENKQRDIERRRKGSERRGRR